MKSLWFYTCPIGKIGIAEKNGAICHVFFNTEASPDGFTLQKSPLMEKVERQLTEYFSGSRKTFDLPLNLGGTEFYVATRDRDIITEAVEAIKRAAGLA